MTSEDLEIVITRVFDAPRAMVWNVWTETDHIEKWWGPKGFSTRVEQNDFRPGGKNRLVMTGPDGKEYPVGGVIKEIVPYEKIVSTDEFEDDFEAPDGVDLPQGIVMTILFEEEGGKTRLTLRIRHPDMASKQAHLDMGVVGGWNSTLDCLEDYLVQTKG